MSDNTTTSTQIPQFAEQGPKLNDKQVKVRYTEAVAALEKQHKLQKLQAEIAVFRAKEIEANMYYMDLMQKFNASQNATGGSVVGTAKASESAGLPTNDLKLDTEPVN